jgi:hypothetical protein
MPTKTLQVYLNSHRSGGVVARSVVDSLRRSGDGGLAAEMDWLRGQLAEDLSTLERVMERLAVPTSRLHSVGARIAGQTAVARMSARRAQSPAGGELLGLETLAVGIQGKLALWRSLRAAAPDRLGDVDLGTLIERGVTQFDRVEALRVKTAGQALVPVERR